MNIDTFRKQNAEECENVMQIDSVNQTDWRLFMAKFADESVDLVVTDPPYWTLDKWREMGTTARLGGHRDPEKRREDMWFPTIQESDLTDLLCEVTRVLKADRHAYIFCDHEVLPIILDVTKRQYLWRYVKPLIWDKVNAGMGYHYRASYEFIVMLEHGKRRLANLGVQDVLHFPRVVNGYPTEKPQPLIDLLVRQSATPGELVIDPFCGAGGVALAAQAIGAHFLVSDISERAVNETTRRLSQLPMLTPERAP